MRGKAGGDDLCPVHLGITPAYAGKSRRKLSRSCTVQDHPRLCGEKLTVCTKSGSSPGSPPPMRGKGFGGWLKQARQGITPAYAGKSCVLYEDAKTCEDHPRLCGEKSVWHDDTHSVPGSPPPMRGKVLRGSMIRRMSGITPAYAGKRIFSLFSHAPQTGSPPPMRGKGKKAELPCVHAGITPAYAGKSHALFIMLARS